ncbi:MAG: hypothetical protein QOJ55_2168, partial [Solirubrobacteraceae bacterium]|nr:hypothetical protein [Solirubrobacteraceae bacterium]
ERAINRSGAVGDAGSGNGAGPVRRRGQPVRAGEKP